MVFSPPVLIKRRASLLLLRQLLLQTLVPAFVVTRDEDDDDDHQDQEAPGRRPHDDHQHALAQSGSGGLCGKGGLGRGPRGFSLG